MRRGRKYRNPPVIEALCEIYFAGSEWDDTIPGQFFGAVKKEFPVKRQREIQQAQILIGQGQAEAGVKRLPPRMQFVSGAGDRMVQVGQNLLVVNQLQPYPSFEDWQPTISRCLDVYQDLGRPSGVARLGVRYINRVLIREGKVPLEKYFRVYPQLPKGMGDEHGAFMVRVEKAPTENGHAVVVTFASAAGQPSEGQAFLLDIYDTYHRGESFPLAEVLEQASKGHDNVELAFEGSITDELRKLFEPEDSK